jgi:hypothetical protein
LASDIGSGEGQRDKSTQVIARVIGHGRERRVEIVKIPLVTNQIRANVFSNYLMDADYELSNPTHLVDWGGLGINVCQDLEDAGRVVHRVIWGNPCNSRENRNRYLNLRAQASHQAAMAAKEGRLSILTEAHKSLMVGQSSRIPRLFTDKSRIKVPPKGSPEWEGLGSPDLWDAVCFLFLENFYYIPAGGETFRVEDAKKSLSAAAASAFSDVKR